MLNQDFLKKDAAAATYQTKPESSKFVLSSELEAEYLKSDNALTTYQLKSDMTAFYDKTSADSTFVTKTYAESMYETAENVDNLISSITDNLTGLVAIDQFDSSNPSAELSATVNKLIEGYNSMLTVL